MMLSNLQCQKEHSEKNHKPKKSKKNHKHWRLFTNYIGSNFENNMNLKRTHAQNMSHRQSLISITYLNQSCLR